MSHAPSRMDLLHTKLCPPPVREKQVVRTHLLKKIDAALNQRLTLICAPAGYGKTTLLSQWVHRQPGPVGWVSIDHNENDLVQFLRYFLAALQHIEPRIGVLIPEMLQAPRPLPGSAVWMPLINEVATSKKEFVVILDDYQEVDEQVVHEACEFLIEHMPNNLHLVIASRADPPLPLPRLRARGYLSELRLNDLRFTTQEIADFLNNMMSLGLSVEDMAALEARTEGWITSLQMAALSLQMRSPELTTRSAFIQAFTGSHRFILDYLVEEVLEHQSPDLQDFLLKTSILERLSGLLCEAVVSERGDAGEEELNKSLAGQTPIASCQSILEHLEAANLFIIPLDDERSWYRYHRLFSDLLRKRLLQRSPHLVPALHHRASQWYEQHGFVDAAIHHALAGESYERAATLIEDNVEATLMRSEVKTFLNWMEKLPDEYWRARPKIAFFRAWALLMSGQSVEVVERHLQDMTSSQAGAESKATLDGRMAAMRAYLMLFRADFHLAAKLCHHALENLPESDVFLRSIATWILSIINLSDGEVRDGKQALDEVIRMGQEIGNSLIVVAALSHKARLQMRQGCLQLAHQTLEQALQLATDTQGRRLPIASEALIGLGELEREWNNLEKAAPYLTEAIELARQWSELASFDAYFPLMRLRLAQGNVDAAREALEVGWQMAHGSEFSQLDDVLADLQQAYFFVTQGKIAEVMRWAELRGLTGSVTAEDHAAPDVQQGYVMSHLRKYESLVLARALIHQGRALEALELLEDLLAQARQLDRTDLKIEINILKALALQLEGDDLPALEALGEALSLAEGGGYVRIFLDEGEAMARLLRQAIVTGLAPAYVQKLLVTFGEKESIKGQTRLSSSDVQALIEPLSERELEVLRLLASGLTNPEIASELYIAVSTVRTHCKNIYAKLDVRRRWDAVQKGRELGLI